MTGYESKRAAAQDKLKCQCSMSTKLVGSGCQYCNPEYMDDDDAQPAQEPTLQEQLDKTYAKWNKDGAELLKAYAEIKRIRVTCIINDGINTPPAQEKNNGT